MPRSLVARQLKNFNISHTHTYVVDRWENGGKLIYHQMSAKAESRVTKNHPVGQNEQKPKPRFTRRRTCPESGGKVDKLKCPSNRTPFFVSGRETVRASPGVLVSIPGPTRKRAEKSQTFAAGRACPRACAPTGHNLWNPPVVPVQIARDTGHLISPGSTRGVGYKKKDAGRSPKGRSLGTRSSTARVPWLAGAWRSFKNSRAKKKKKKPTCTHYSVHR